MNNPMIDKLLKAGLNLQSFSRKSFVPPGEKGVKSVLPKTGEVPGGENPVVKRFKPEVGVSSTRKRAGIGSFKGTLAPPDSPDFDIKHTKPEARWSSSPIETGVSSRKGEWDVKSQAFRANEQLLKASRNLSM